MNLRERLAGIDANVDDVQANAEAWSRATDALDADTSKFNGLLKAELLRSVLRHVSELQACAQDQQAAVQELRNALARLRHELKVPRRAAIRPATFSDPQRHRRGMIPE